MSKVSIQKKSILNLLLAIIIGSVISSFDFYTLESTLYDARFRSRPVNTDNNLIKIVTIDSKTLEGGTPSIADHDQLLTRLLAEGPTFIIYTFPFEKIAGTLSEKNSFAQSASQFTNFLSVYDDVVIKSEENKLIAPAPYSKLTRLPGVITYDKSNFARDEVSRRALIFYQGRMMLQPYVASYYNGITNLNDYRGAFEYKDALQTNINYQKPGVFKHLSFEDIKNGQFAKGTFENKIVLIGYDDKFTPEYYIKTPFTRDVIGMPKVEAHAHVLKTFIENSGIIKTKKWFNSIVTIVFSLVTVFSVFLLPPIRALLIIVSSVIGYCFISWVLFAFGGIAIGMAQPIIAIFVCYYLLIPYRLISENKKYWELTQKNKLLTQVEELKNNFLSMMSHDLKTPLARIQGMADVALSNKENLDTNQQTAIKTIRQSADELTEFITNILDLSRVESQKIKLNLQSKDINTLLDEVIKKHEFLALEKNIEIVREYEPLFSVKIDTDLMKQVFGNLVENAIKYSPTGSKILVTTEEADGHIIVQVADQGIGITETEIKNIFTKFYRTKNVKNSQIKGSGLGLYLAKYFVELHKGEISVESLPRQGSTFTVDIPMEH